MLPVAPDRNNTADAVDETETLSGRLLLTIEKRKVFLTAILKPFGKGGAYSPAHRGRKSPDEKTGNRLSRKNKGD
ncbi:hypothetical protein AB4Z34_01040 [Ensifer sp. 2YAB10]|uniref:hypothetical protein n=1 Tax=unclassified Ensifer TaxID=2633371 RepID=UPI003F908C7B